jgi:hypothetical protein
MALARYNATGEGAYGSVGMPGNSGGGGGGGSATVINVAGDVNVQTSTTDPAELATAIDIETRKERAQRRGNTRTPID